MHNGPEKVRGRIPTDEFVPANPSAVPHGRPRSFRSYQVVLVFVNAAIIATALVRHPGSFAHPIFITWAGAMALVSVFPLPAWRGTRLGMEFPLSIALTVMYGPVPAGLITFVGSFDEREFRREVSLLRALFNRSQVALATMLAGAVFRIWATPDSSFALVMSAAVPTVIAGYFANVSMVAAAASLDIGVRIRVVLTRLTVGSLPQFLTSYLGLGLAGAALASLASLHPNLGQFTVVILVLPLLLARHLYLRGQVLEKTTKELERSSAQMKMLQGLAGKLDRLNDVKRIARTIVDDLGGLIAYRDCRIYQLEPDGTTLLPIAFRAQLSDDDPVAGREGMIAQVGEGVPGRVVALAKTVSVQGTPEGEGSIVGVPLASGDEVFGAIVLSKDGIDQFDEADIRLLEVLASRAAVAFQNARLLQREQAAARWYRTLLDQLPALTYLNRPDGTPIYASPHIEALLGYQPGEWVAGTQQWERHIHPDDQAAVAASRERGVATGDPCTIEYRLCDQAGATRWVRDESVLVRGEHGPSYWQGVVTDITDRKEADERIAYLAFHDQLTDLPNRAMFADLLKQAMARAKRHDGAVALVALDFDDFKLVNDGLGHDAGDELLRCMATILRESVRETDLPARVGGDEFLVMLPDLPAEASGTRAQALAAAVAMAERIRDRLKVPQRLAGTDVRVSASMGISVYPLDAEDAPSLLKHADAALYLSKKTSPGGYVQYETPTRSSAGLSLMTRLRKAVAERQWLLEYQPVVDLTDASPRSVEALLRWQESAGVLTSPHDFIPTAEEMGLMPAIGEWVVGELSRQLVAWREARLEVDVSFNISSRQLWNPAVTRDLLITLEEHDLDPASVTVEITESAVMTEASGVNRTLHSLQDLGIRIAVDDFGTAYSSLSRLKDLPVSIVKIDRSFVRELSTSQDARSIVTAMLQLINSLGLVAVAKGIETEEQRRFLSEHGCGLGQGFLFYRPLPAGDIPALFSSANQGTKTAAGVPSAGRRAR
jgi:diguanylate cyclase (GGDEF)-like protein/PAS domain S-box-containing protein